MTLSIEEQRLARATKKAIEAAGGLKVCSHETGLSNSQLSRCSSPNNRDSITVRDVAAIEAITHGQSGHPHITRALAAMAGGVFVMLPDVDESDDAILVSVVQLADELGDVSHEIQRAVCSHSDEGSEISPREAERALRQLDDLDEASARLRMQLNGIAGRDNVRTLEAAE